MVYAFMRERLKKIMLQSIQAKSNKINLDELSRLVRAMSNAYANLEVEEPEPKQENEYIEKWKKTKAFERTNIIPRIPSNSTLLIGTCRQGKSILMKLWERQLFIESKKLLYKRNSLVKIEDDAIRTPEFRKINSCLCNYSRLYITESDIVTAIKSFSYEVVKDLLAGKRYVFIDDFLYKPNWEETLKSSSGSRVRTGFKILWDYLVDNQDKVIVIGSTNSDISKTWFDEPIESRIREIFLNRFEV